jgi:hypothetical protein
MPRDYNPDSTPANRQRRPHLAKDDAWVRAFLRRAPIARIATVWGDQPFINPTTFWYDEERNQLIFHSNASGRIRANSDQHNRVCVEVSEFGQFLPSNVALEFSVQYASVIVYGVIRVVEDFAEKRRLLSGLIAKYFPDMAAGQAYRPITDGELRQTSAYAIPIESWSGKENWARQADQSDEWPPLEAEILNKPRPGPSAVRRRD